MLKLLVYFQLQTLSKRMLACKYVDCKIVKDNTLCWCKKGQKSSTIKLVKRVGSSFRRVFRPVLDLRVGNLPTRHSYRHKNMSFSDPLIILVFLMPFYGNSIISSDQNNFVEKKEIICVTTWSLINFGVISTNLFDTYAFSPKTVHENKPMRKM